MIAPNSLFTNSRTVGALNIVISAAYIRQSTILMMRQCLPRFAPIFQNNRNPRPAAMIDKELLLHFKNIPFSRMKGRDRMKSLFHLWQGSGARQIAERNGITVKELTRWSKLAHRAAVEALTIDLMKQP